MAGAYVKVTDFSVAQAIQIRFDERKQDETIWTASNARSYCATTTKSVLPMRSIQTLRPLPQRTRTPINHNV